MATSIKKLKKDFESWSGFPLESEDLEGILGEIKSRSWDLKCEIDQQAGILEIEAEKLFT